MVGERLNSSQKRVDQGEKGVYSSARSPARGCAHRWSDWSPQGGLEQRSAADWEIGSDALSHGVTRAMKKSQLPQKICRFCNRPFAWRRKWARDWEKVRYCCRRAK